MFDTVLIANRGEIALRVVRTCRDMGIATVVVHSGADRDSAAVRAADRHVNIGPADPHRSYLYPPAVIEAARNTGAQAIHPGYGFLSEDPDFATICAENGIVFVGPAPEVMARLGDKSTARRLMADAGLPVLPGSPDPVETADEAAEVARRIGFPLIVKAVAGGGGRGMAVVPDAGALLPAFRATRATAQAAFGDNRVYLERYLAGARHIEIQILADGHGNVVHLGERDCSVQRRHQKLVEESPAPCLPAGQADRLAAHAVAGARAVGYRGAGTFEFLVRGEEAAFIEVNSRIQVEHPVTETVTGIDIVREQLLIAAGRPLGLDQERVRPRGASVEVRINAEDPARDFAPCPGTLTAFDAPAGPFVRVDTHAFPGSQARPEYDSLLAKIVTWGPDRDQALARMRRALGELRVEGPGIHTTAPLLAEILDDPDFRAGRHDTTLLDRRTGT
ncbi:acetyl/propionyl/methylcrotonyl-CoA carboxylase subunit alpha [Embleya sp. NPDC050493]|uniref:acetyl/propionyl/methylcrotonyl-CoA carboxylase subunit alpha n=1 Tax=Embleya sp. NPDC050493 TaxID=3363989 RepID=UPI0037B3C525